ncbi:unnamed protein product [Rhodiola kirilowii]
MASTSASSSLPLASSSSTIIDAKSALRQSAIGVSLPTLPPPPFQSHTHSSWKATTYCRKIVRNVASMATGEAPAEVAAFETPEIVKTVQEYWDKLEDKYAVSSLVVAAGVGLVASTGVVAVSLLPYFSAPECLYTMLAATCYKSVYIGVDCKARLGVDYITGH